MSRNVFIFYKWKHLLPQGVYFAYLLKYCEKKLVSLPELHKHEARLGQKTLTLEQSVQT